jgi:hypothetical protein
MLKNSFWIFVAAGVVGASTLTPTSVSAHITMDGPVKDRGGDQKVKPCGGQARSSTPFTFEPGATITLGVSEAIPHDGYFRISFDDDGIDGFKDPESIDPINPNRYGTGKKCQGTADDNCGKSDFCSVTSNDGGPTVLWDNLDPHLGASSGLGKKWAWTVTLPNVECDNCTLQVMQVMEDPAGGAHGPFDGEDDLYYRCVDIVLKKGAGKTPGTVDTKPQNKGMSCVESTGAQPSPSDAGVPPTQSGPDPVVAGDAGTPAEPMATPGPRTDAGSSTSPGKNDAGSTSSSSKPDAARPPSNTGTKDAGVPQDEDEDGNDENQTEDDDAEDDAEDDGASSTAADDGCSMSAGRPLSFHSGVLGLLVTASLLRNRRRRLGEQH